MTQNLLKLKNSTNKN